MAYNALAAARATAKWADCGPLPHEIATAHSSGAQEHQIGLFFEVPIDLAGVPTRSLRLHQAGDAERSSA